MALDDNKEIAKRLQMAINHIKWPEEAQEPDIVATLVKVLPEFIENILTSIIPSRKILTRSAFIHQKPLAHFVHEMGFSDPELGDLLIVCREKRFSGDIYNAMLLQAKRENKISTVSIPDDHQYILYSKWPEFIYKRADYLDGKRRSVLPKTITQGAQYLLIEKSNPSKMYTATTDIPLKASKPFAFTLASILSFEGGRTFQVPNERDDWSQMIIDLLNLSAISTFNRIKSGHIKEPRLKGGKVFDFIINTANDADNTTEFMQYINNETDDDIKSIGVICVDFVESFEGEIVNQYELKK